MPITKRALAEFFGTFWLVLGGCGAAVLAAGVPSVGIGYVGVALAFGLTVLTMAFAIGHVSGCHLNPAVSIGLAVGKRFAASDLVAYIVAQVVGVVVGSHFSQKMGEMGHPQTKLHPNPAQRFLCLNNFW
jgi:aquaporin Z